MSSTDTQKTHVYYDMGSHMFSATGRFKKSVDSPVVELRRFRARPTGCQTLCRVWAVIFIPMPLSPKVIQASLCPHLLSENVLQTLLGMGMGMNITAHCLTATLSHNLHYDVGNDTHQSNATRGVKQHLVN